MAKSIQEEHSSFTEPEMEAALQLIQLSAESDVDVTGNGNGFRHSSGEVLATKTMKKRGKKVGDYGESEGSSTSDITSAPAPARFGVPRFETENDDEIDDHSDVGGTGTGSRRRKRKKFRSVSDIYKISTIK